MGINRPIKESPVGPVSESRGGHNPCSSATDSVLQAGYTQPV